MTLDEFIILAALAILIIVLSAAVLYGFSRALDNLDDWDGDYK